MGKGAAIGTFKYQRQEKCCQESGKKLLQGSRFIILQATLIGSPSCRFPGHTTIVLPSDPDFDDNRGSVIGTVHQCRRGLIHNGKSGQSAAISQTLPYGILILQCRVVDAQYNTVVPVDVDPVFLVVVVRSSRPSQFILASLKLEDRSAVEMDAKATGSLTLQGRRAIPAAE
ncbi:hypothetical protein B0O80DRAFT_426501 [Mortierella sp. GBAus27b]|nr:hypothetical protein B0O80DRAFT_426501 [Mortierella sp. GBAus27b]